MSEIQSYRDLKVWRKGIEIVKDVYALCDKLPEQEQFGLKSQMQRAAVSIPCNIAEGYGRNSSKNYAQFLRTSRGSLYELETLLIITKELGMIEEEEYKSLAESMSEEAKMMNAFIKAISTN